MSYSFTLRGGSVEELKALVADEFTRIVQQQVSHAVDREQAQAAAGAYLDMFDVPEGKDLLLTMSGSIAGPTTGSGLDRLNAAGVQLNVYVVDKLPPPLS